MSIGGYGFGWLSMGCNMLFGIQERVSKIYKVFPSEFQDLVDDYNNLDVEQLEELANQSESEAWSFFFCN